MSDTNYNNTNAKPYRVGGTDVAIADGGTGKSTAPTSGQLLIGKADGSYALTTLTDGANVTITEGDGTITIATTAGGDVVGPAGATANAIVRFNSTTGKLIKDTSTATISDAGVISCTGWLISS